MCLIVISALAHSQVGVNTVNPQGVFNVDGAKDNPTTGVPNAAQQSNDFTVTNTGNVGIGTTAPSAKLDLAGTIKIKDGSQGANKVLTSDANGLASWQNPTAGWTAMLRDGKTTVNPSILNFTSGTVIGVGGSANATTDEITVPANGLYEITISVWSNGTANNYLTTWDIRKNDVALFASPPHYVSPSANLGTSTSVTRFADLAAGDKISVYLSNIFPNPSLATQANYSTLVVKLLQ
ncbi:hypothetical protein [Chryseobacterium sp. IT-36CA2]|uniref:hypothetical protein n=1 Tax=Chryseobacterium sp. IT-36CA2 TaxID=3026460 RepID=UPI0039E04049